MIVSERSGVFAHKWILFGGLAIVALLAALWKPAAHVAFMRKSKVLDVSQASVPGSPRKVFPLSVIRGGAYTAAELARARRTDPVIDAHYASFGSHPVFKKTSRDLLMYVSYRQGKEVYWSQTRHRIAKGETVIADGAALARARCGNRLSATPQTPVAVGKQPAEDVMNTPEAPEESVSYDLAALPSPKGSPFQFFLPAGLDTPLNGVFPTAAITGGSGPASGHGGGGFGGGPGSFGGGGGGPLLGASRPASNNSTPANSGSAAPGTAGTPILGGIGSASGPVASPVQGVAISSNGLPTSPNYPVSTGTPSGTATELVPEPSMLGFSLLALALLLVVKSFGCNGVLRR